MVSISDQRCIVRGPFRIGLAYTGSNLLVDGLEPLCVRREFELLVINRPVSLRKRVSRLHGVQSRQREESIRRIEAIHLTGGLDRREDRTLQASANLVRDVFDFDIPDSIS